MAELDGLGGFGGEVAALEAELGGAGTMVAAFTAELARMQATAAEAGRDVAVLSGGIGRGLRRAFDGLLFDGMKLSDALRTVGRSMADAAYSAALRPVTNHLGGLLGEGVAAILGGGFLQGRVTPFAKGGVVSGAHLFPMRSGIGMLGEAGPEAILPLARGADGRLGVRGGGGAVSVVVNVATPDVEGFRRSRSQVAAELGRALGRGARNR